MSDRHALILRHKVRHDTDEFLDVLHVMVEVDDQRKIYLQPRTDSDMMESLNGGVFLTPLELKQLFPSERGIRYVVYDAATQTFLPMTEDEYAITEV